MKTRKLTFNLPLILLFLFCSISFGQSNNLVVITLTVNTAELGSNRNAPGGCTLTANPASAIIFDDGNPKLFTIEVPNGTEIEWDGITTDGKDVKIKKIGYVKGINIFNKTNIPGTISGGKEKVKDKVKRKTPEGMEYEYLIDFKIKGFGRFTLDPRIKVN